MVAAACAMFGAVRRRPPPHGVGDMRDPALGSLNEVPIGGVKAVLGSWEKAVALTDVEG